MEQHIDTAPTHTATTGTATTDTARPVVRLTRSRDDRMIAGVCGGAARAYGLDPALVRLVLVLLTVFGAGSGLIAYVAAWILVPEEPAPTR